MKYYYKNKDGEVFTNTGTNPNPVKYGVKYDFYPINRTSFIPNSNENVIAIKDGTDPSWSAAWQSLPQPQNYGKYRPTFLCCFKKQNVDSELQQSINWEDSTVGPKTGYYPTLSPNQDFHCFKHINFYSGKSDFFNKINLDNCSVYEWNAPETDLANYSTTGSEISNSTLSTKNKTTTMKQLASNSTWFWNQSVPETGGGQNSDGDYRYKIIDISPTKKDYKFETEIVKLEDKFSAIKIPTANLAEYSKLKISFMTTQNVSLTSLSTFNDIENYVNNGANYKTTSSENPYYGIWFFEDEDKIPHNEDNPSYYYCKSTLELSTTDNKFHNTGMIPEPFENNAVRKLIKYDSMSSFTYTKDDLENARYLYITDFNVAEEYNDQTKQIDYSAPDHKIASTTYYSQWPTIKQGTYLSSYFDTYPSLKEFMKTAVMLTGYGGSNGTNFWFYNYQSITGAGTTTGYSWCTGGDCSKTECELPTQFYPTTDYGNNYVRSVATLENCQYEIDLSENEGKSALYILYPTMTTLENESVNNYEPIYSKFQMFIEGIKTN